MSSARAGSELNWLGGKGCLIYTHMSGGGDIMSGGGKVTQQVRAVEGLAGEEV